MKASCVALFAACSILALGSCSTPIDYTGDYQSDGWTVTNEGGRFTASRALQGSSFDAQIDLSGDQDSVNEFINDKWDLTVGSGGEELAFARKGSAQAPVAIVSQEQKIPRSVSIKVTLSAPAGARSTALSGYLVKDSWLCLERDWIWWNLSAWTECAGGPADTGNVDLYLYRETADGFIQTSASTQPGKAYDAVGDAWWLAATMRLKIVAVETSTYVGSISW